MAVAVGHAGSECSSDVLTLRELAMHAEAAARREESSTVLAAGELERPLATATELEVALRLAQLAAERDGATSRDEIASVAADLTVLLGFEGRERITAQFCAAVADIGAALIDDDSDPLEAAIALLGPIAGPTVGAVLRAVGERWDGSGKPDGLVGQAIPVAARVIAVAEQLIADSYSTTNIESFSETQFDPAVVRAAQQLVSQR
ncbi:MAG: hypothetical protein HY826_13575 [Actinobacteria bacterium]|nr:hypothetical protein [Actinomycetota bacterium]